MISIQVEKLTAFLIDEIDPLLCSHYDELALDQSNVPLAPMWDRYFAIQENNELLIVTCRDDEVLIGYFVGFISKSLHYETCLTCSMDIFYVAKEHRKGSLGIRLFKYVERELRSRKVQRWFVGSKVHADASKLFERLKFSKIEVYYSKWLGG